jgi:hypothetical protein
MNKAPFEPQDKYQESKVSMFKHQDLTSWIAGSALLIHGPRLILTKCLGAHAAADS